jgi:hypothetical protein
MSSTFIPYVNQTLPTPYSSLRNITKTLVPPIPLWLYKYLALFPVTGFLGLDHLAIGSQYSFFIKLIVNFLTLGSWYAYDIIQVYNKKGIYKDGLDVPFFDFGGIGVERISAEPMKNMSNNTKLWLYVLFVGLFGSVYYISSFFLSKSDSIFSNLIYLTSKTTFWLTIILAIYTLLFYFFTKGFPFFQNVAIPLSGVSTVPALFNQYNLADPATVRRTSINPLTAPLIQTPAFQQSGVFVPQLGGGDMEEIKNISEKLISGGSISIHNGDINKEFLIFGLILTLIPISGFIVYFLRKKNAQSKKDEISTKS